MKDEYAHKSINECIGYLADQIGEIGKALVQQRVMEWKKPPGYTNEEWERRYAKEAIVDIPMLAASVQAIMDHLGLRLKHVDAHWEVEKVEKLEVKK